jgi:anti-sigma B factor antagonist
MTNAERRQSAAVVLEPHEQTDPSFWDALSGAVDGAETVIVDLTRVEQLDSRAVGLLITATRNSRRNGAQLILTGPRPEIREIFNVTQLDRLFTIRDTADVARREFT